MKLIIESSLSCHSFGDAIAVIITGKDKFYSNGLDLAEMESMSISENVDAFSNIQKLLLRWPPAANGLVEYMLQEGSLRWPPLYIVANPPGSTRLRGVARETMHWVTVAYLYCADKEEGSAPQTHEELTLL